MVFLPVLIRTFYFEIFIDFEEKRIPSTCQNAPLQELDFALLLLKKGCSATSQTNATHLTLFTTEVYMSSHKILSIS